MRTFAMAMIIKCEHMMRPLSDLVRELWRDDCIGQNNTEVSAMAADNVRNVWGVNLHVFLKRLYFMLRSCNSLFEDHNESFPGV